MTGERAAVIAVVAVAGTGLAWWLAGELLDSRDRRRERAARHARHAKRDEVPQDEAVPQQREPGEAA